MTRRDFHVLEEYPKY